MTGPIYRLCTEPPMAGQLDRCISIQVRDTPEDFRRLCGWPWPLITVIGPVAADRRHPHAMAFALAL